MALIDSAPIPPNITFAVLEPLFLLPFVLNPVVALSMVWLSFFVSDMLMFPVGGGLYKHKNTFS